MKIMKGIAATTGVDGHGERRSKEDLEEMAVQIRESYMPQCIDHDPLGFPVGRIASAMVRQTSRSDSNEWELHVDIEFWEESDRESLLAFGEREMLSQEVEPPCPVVLLDRGFRNTEGQELAKFIASEGGEVRFHNKKSIDPNEAGILISIILFIFAPAYTNAYNNILAKMQEHRSKTKTNQLLIIKCNLPSSGESLCELSLAVDGDDGTALNYWNPAQTTHLIDRAGPLIAQFPQARQIAFRAQGETITLKHIVLSNCVPIDGNGEVIITPVKLASKQALSIGFSEPWKDVESNSTLTA